MVIIISGTDSYRSRKRLLQLVAAFQKKFDPHGYNVSRFSGSSLTMAALQGALGTQSLLGSKKMVVIEGLLVLKSGETTKQIMSYIADHLSADCICILYEQVNLTKAALKHKALKDATHEEFPELVGADMQKYIASEIQVRGLTLDRAAYVTLQERIGSDAWMLSTTLDQLLAYAPGKTITKDDVAHFTEASFDDNIFHFTDALGKKDRMTSLELLYDQLESGSHPLYILTMLVRQFRLLLMFSQSTDVPEGVHPFVAQKTRQQVRLFTHETLKRSFRDLIDMDAQLKRGFQDPETLLTRFIVRATEA